MLKKIKVWLYRRKEIRSIKKYGVVFEIYDPWNRKKVENVLKKQCTRFSGLFNENNNAMVYFIISCKNGFSIIKFLSEILKEGIDLSYYNDEIFGAGFVVLTDHT